MNFKKRVNGSWTDTPHYIHNTSTDTITTLPAVLYPNDTTATVGLKGQTLQSSAPSPTSPVMPQGTGVRTGNLFDGLLIGGLFMDANFNVSGNADVYKSIKVFLLAGTYTFSWGKNVNFVRLIIDSNYSQPAYNNISSRTITSTTDGYVGISFRDTTSSSTVWDDTTPIMLNTGSTPLPYEPFGYKLTISSANTTTPIYLGEVETTRKIRKYECTGDESWSVTLAQSKTRAVANFTTSIGIEPLSKVVSTHYIGVEGGASYPDINTISVNNNGTMIIGITSDFTDSNAFKSYLAAQYAAGTPVTVWYVLATPETAVVNEPLMKIGEYADTLSNISIPVTAGGDTLSVDTTVQPSEITVNYKGWHPVADVHERENGAWT